MKMKFSFASAALTIALLAMAVVWVVGEYRHAEQLELIRVEAERDIRLEKLYALRIGLIRNSSSLTTVVGSLGNYKYSIALDLISEFNRLAKSSKDADAEFYEEDCFNAGKALHYIGWDCSTPDELRAHLNEFQLRLHRDPPPLISEAFATKVLNVKAKLEKESGSASSKEPLTKEAYELDDRFGQSWRN